MQRSRARTVVILLKALSNLFPFPVNARCAVGNPVAGVAMVLLSSFAGGVINSARAEPLVASQSMSRLAGGPFVDFVAEAAQRFGIPAHWINAVMLEESGGEVRAVSPQGAMGLMQIMPDTWNDLRSRHGLGADPFEPRDNILAGAAYLREMHDRYGSPGFLAAYNAGPKRYEQYLETGRELPTETQLYVVILAPIIGAAQVDDTAAIARRTVHWQDSPLFAALGEGGALAKSSPSDRSSVGRLNAGLSALAPRADGLFIGHASAGLSR